MTKLTNLQASITLTRPDNSTLVTVLPVAANVDNVTAFDGTIDFGGTSGKTYEGLTADQMDMVLLTSAADLALFSGAGNISLPVDATGASAGSGAGNLITQFNTQASAGGMVTYDFTPIPEPTSVVLAGLAGALLAIRRRRQG